MYPNDDELAKVEKYSYEDGYKGLVEYLLRIWSYGDGAVVIKEGRSRLFKRRVMKLELHTYGWSGNEDIIISLRKNYMFWSTSWQKSIRGGHYYFDIEKCLYNKPKLENANG
jgi:hypothetical protein